MEEQQQNGLDQYNQFIDQLIGDKAAEFSPEDLAEMKKDISNELDDALNRAILNKLSDAALAELENYTDDNPTAFAELILAKARAENLDLNAITADTLLQFKALYTGEVMADDLDAIGGDTAATPEGAE